MIKVTFSEDIRFLRISPKTDKKPEVLNHFHYLKCDQWKPTNSSFLIPLNLLVSLHLHDEEEVYNHPLHFHCLYVYNSSVLWATQSVLGLFLHSATSRSFRYWLNTQSDFWPPSQAQVKTTKLRRQRNMGRWTDKCQMGEGFAVIQNRMTVSKIFVSYFRWCNIKMFICMGKMWLLNITKLILLEETQYQTQYLWSIVKCILYHHTLHCSLFFYIHFLINMAYKKSSFSCYFDSYEINSLSRNFFVVAVVQINSN